VSYAALAALLAALVLWAEMTPQGLTLAILAGIGVGFTLAKLPLTRRAGLPRP